jgi:LPS O-antigen subunit length determinant protein (WzzB/FepE family)
MKKIIITAVLAVALAAGAFAAPKKVSSAILANFETEFKKASNVTWLVTHDYTKAAFTADNINMEVYYNFAGDIIGRSRSITPDELPVKAKRILAKKFAGYEAKEAIRFDGFDEAAYYISGENKKESVIIKVTDSNEVSLFKKTKK